MSENTFAKNYISNWTLNAKQHFESNDYEWVCDFIQKCFPDGTCKRILELGCGSGYSTLVFLKRHYQVISIDINSEAIERTEALVKAHNYTAKIKATNESDIHQADALLWQKDLIDEWGLVYALTRQQARVNPIDLIVLCNPVGNVSREITAQERDLLLSGGFSEDEICANIQWGTVDLLHKWAVVYASCALANATFSPLLIVERDTENDIASTLTQISTNTNMLIMNYDTRIIKKAPEDGTQLMNASSANSQQCWGAALLIPHDS